jgi:hypothetical protein
MATVYMGDWSAAAPTSRRGANIALFRISASTTVSVGDTWVIGKLPHGAIPVGAVFYAAAQVNAKFGTSASLELFFVSDTYSTVAGAQGGGVQSNLRLGSAQQISCTAADAQQFEKVTMVAGTTDASLGYIGDLVVTYLMPT